MAVDTRNKRASVLGIGLAFRLVLPAPDASVDTADRAHVAYSYAGLAADSPIPYRPSVRRTARVPYESRTVVVPRERRVAVVPYNPRTGEVD